MENNKRPFFVERTCFGFFFEHGWGTIIIKDGIRRYSFDGSAMEINPLNRIIEALCKMHEGHSHCERIACEGEPSGYVIVFNKEGEDLHIQIYECAYFFSEQSARNIMDDIDIPLDKESGGISLALDIVVIFQTFVMEVCSEALRNLKEHGIVGYARSNSSDEFPFSSLLVLLGINQDEESDSNFDEEIRMLTGK
jgi:hypothetical protein